MKYEYWVYPESSLLVEKYAKIINKEDLLKHKGALFAEIEKVSNEVLALIDISQATFFNIQHDEISDIYNSMLERISKKSTMRLAIYNGDNARDDFLKTSLFAKYESERINIENFIELNQAMQWLNLNERERFEVKRRLVPEWK